MDIKQCSRGHYYDGDRYPDGCPYCPESSSPKLTADDSGETVPLFFGNNAVFENRKYDASVSPGHTAENTEKSESEIEELTADERAFSVTENKGIETTAESDDTILEFADQEKDTVLYFTKET